MPTSSSTGTPGRRRGCLAVRPEDPAARRAAVESWIEERIRGHGDVALGLAARLRSLLDEVRDVIASAESNRFVYRIDATNLIKSPASILDKMARSHNGDRPRYDFRSFTREMDDIGRFRVVASFLSDVKRIAETIDGAYARPETPRSRAQAQLEEEFELCGGKVEDRIALLPKDREKGERCMKARFRLRSGELQGLIVEAQIQTHLQEAWDRKDHYLIYEPRRCGEQVLDDDEREIFAMSEMLYVADLTFDRLRERVLDERKKKR